MKLNYREWKKYLKKFPVMQNCECHMDIQVPMLTDPNVETQVTPILVPGLWYDYIMICSFIYLLLYT